MDLCRLPSQRAFSEDQSDRDIRKQANEKREALYQHDAIETHQIHLVVRQIEQRAVNPIEQVSGKQITAYPKEQKQVAENEATQQHLGNGVEQVIGLLWVSHAGAFLEVGASLVVAFQPASDLPPDRVNPKRLQTCRLLLQWCSPVH